MKKITTTAAAAAAATAGLASILLSGGTASAVPSRGGGCTNCHATDNTKSLTISPNPLTITKGKSGLLTLQVNSLGFSSNTALSVQGLENSALNASVLAGGNTWTHVTGSGGTSWVSNYITSTGPYTMNLGIGSLATVGTYPITVMFCGDGPSGISKSVSLTIQQAIAGIWNGGAGNWSDSTKWSDGAVPNSASVHLKIDNGNAMVSAVTLNQNATVGDIGLDASDTLIVNAAQTLTLAGPATSVLRGSLTLNGRVDLGAGKIVTTTPVGSWSGGAYTGVCGLVRSGRNGGNWSGAGIVTSQSSAMTNNFTSVGVATAQQVKSLAGATATATWGGQTVTGSDTLVMYTYAGDANLDGKINVDDYGRIDLNIPLGTSGWFNGDFNYDGIINVDDYGIIDFNIGIQGAPLPTGSSPLAGSAKPTALAAVPEPSTSALLIAAAWATMASRRRRRRSMAHSGTFPIFSR